MLTKRQEGFIKKQDEYNATLVMLTQQDTPCGDSCKACKCQIKGEAFGTTCIHLILRRIVEEMVK
jgi:hypothetical protein